MPLERNSRACVISFGIMNPGLGCEVTWRSCISTSGRSRPSANWCGEAGQTKSRVARVKKDIFDFVFKLCEYANCFKLREQTRFENSDLHRRWIEPLNSNYPEMVPLQGLASVHRRYSHGLATMLFASLASFGARGADYSLTGFGTIGYAVSDQKSPYLRYVDKGGSLKADSLIGLQGEAQFNPQWGATLQVVASAPRFKDEGLAAQARWAFLSYRPDNDWLLRIGKMRVPFLLNTQNSEVGMTFSQARLPVEMYSTFPVYDANGAAFTKTWLLDGSEVNLDGYGGHADFKFRNPFHADPALRLFPDAYVPESANIKGMILTRTSGSLSLRAGIHRAVVTTPGTQKVVDGFFPNTFPAPPPFGGALYAPGKVIPHFGLNLLTFGVEWKPSDWRFSAEYAKRTVKETILGVSSQSFSGTVERDFGRWTPYATYARLLSAPETRQLYRDLNATPVPLGAQGPPLFVPSTFHRILGGQVFVYDQYSVMLGTAYSLSRESKLKFEWMRTHVGLASVLVDGDFRNKSFNVFSLSYNFAF